MVATKDWFKDLCVVHALPLSAPTGRESPLPSVPLIEKGGGERDIGSHGG